MKWVIALFLLASVGAFELGDFPEIFDTAILVVGDEGSPHAVIAQATIAQFLTAEGIQVEAILASELTSLEQHLILIGDPCRNSVMEEVISVPCEDYAQGGLVEVIDHNGFAYFMVAGSTPETVRDAAEVLISAEHSSDEQITFAETETNDLRQRMLDSLQERVVPVAEEEVTEPVCEGCLLGGTCHPYRAVLEDQWCNAGSWVPRLADGQACTEDYHCLTTCEAGACGIPLPAPVELSWWEKVVIWIKGLV